MCPASQDRSALGGLASARQKVLLLREQVGALAAYCDRLESAAGLVSADTSAPLGPAHSAAMKAAAQQLGTPSPSEPPPSFEIPKSWLSSREFAGEPLAKLAKVSKVPARAAEGSPRGHTDTVRRPAPQCDSQFACWWVDTFGSYVWPEDQSHNLTHTGSRLLKKLDAANSSLLRHRMYALAPPSHEMGSGLRWLSGCAASSDAKPDCRANTVLACSQQCSKDSTRDVKGFHEVRASSWSPSKNPKQLEQAQRVVDQTLQGMALGLPVRLQDEQRKLVVSQDAKTLELHLEGSTERALPVRVPLSQVVDISFGARPNILVLRFSDALCREPLELGFSDEEQRLKVALSLKVLRAQ
ncbi:unnamed protein product [Effrenium voratum]|nr:unnamed protein product [Effrenium voratum]